MEPDQSRDRWARDRDAINSKLKTGAEFTPTESRVLRQAFDQTRLDQQLIEALGHVAALFAEGAEIASAPGDRQKQLRLAAAHVGWRTSPTGGRSKGSGVDFEALAFGFAEATKNYSDRTPGHHWAARLEEIASKAMLSRETAIRGLQEYRATIKRELAQATSIGDVPHLNAKLRMAEALGHLPPRGS